MLSSLEQKKKGFMLVHAHQIQGMHSFQWLSQRSEEGQERLEVQVR